MVHLLLWASLYALQDLSALHAVVMVHTCKKQTSLQSDELQLCDRSQDLSLTNAAATDIHC